MGKYERALKDIYSIFDSDAWKIFAIKTFPENYKGDDSEYIVLSVAFAKPGLNRESSSGMLFVEIYTEANKGPLRGLEIASMLDSILSEKSVLADLKLNTQFQRGSVVPMGVDKENPFLFRHSYSIPFSHFGAF